MRSTNDRSGYNQIDCQRCQTWTIANEDGSHQCLVIHILGYLVILEIEKKKIKFDDFRGGENILANRLFHCFIWKREEMV